MYKDPQNQTGSPLPIPPPQGEGGDCGSLGIKCGGPAPRAKQLVRPRRAEALILSARQMPASIQLLDLLNRQLLGFQGELMGIDGTRPQRAAGGKGRDPDAHDAGRQHEAGRKGDRDDGTHGMLPRPGTGAGASSAAAGSMRVKPFTDRRIFWWT